MSNNDAEVDSKIAEGLFPNSTMAYVPEFGTIQNSHTGNIVDSANKAAAMVVANALISVEAQSKNESNIWGDGTVLDLNKLSKRINQYLNKYLQELNHQNEMIFKIKH
jgi:putative spermidine/putrescine transport system substrate-binding protein